MSNKTRQEPLTWQQFEQVGLCVGTIVKAEEFLEARQPAYKLWVDLGEALGVRRSSARITALYTMGELIGKQVICVTGFPPKQIGPFISEVLVTGFYRSADEVVLAVPDMPVANGSRLG